MRTSTVSSTASKRVFADTSFFFALVAKRDPAHQAAVDAYAKLLRARGRLFTTDYVIDETLTLTKARINAQTALALLDRIEASEAVAMENITPERFVAAKTYFRKHADHGWPEPWEHRPHRQPRESMSARETLGRPSSRKPLKCAVKSVYLPAAEDIAFEGLCTGNCVVRMS
jgi:predicted nucleic acid-binding protein